MSIEILYTKDMKRLLTLLIVSLFLGLPVGAKECEEIVPEGAMRLVAASPGANEVTLTWVRPAGLITHYVIYYGLSAGEYGFVGPKVEGAATTTYKIKGLGGGTKFYFAVRAANKCALGQWSNEMTAVSTGAGNDGRPAIGFKREKNVRPTPTPAPSSTPVVEQESGRVEEQEKTIIGSYKLLLIVIGGLMVVAGGAWWWKRRKV